MRNSRLEMLYRTLIKEHSKNPKNKGRLADATAEMELFNPSCGDLVTVQFKVENQKVSDIRFDGNGCAISMASASIMTELMKGETVERALELTELFYEMVKGNEKIETKSLEDAVYLQGVSKFPTRIRCATLSWHALEEGLKKAVKSKEEK